MNKKTARILITTKCNRSCPGCANEKFVGSEHMHIMGDISEVSAYDEIILSGGEPMLVPELLMDTIKQIKNISDAPIFLYSSTVKVYDSTVSQILNSIDGLTYTLHYECTDNDIKMLKDLSFVLGLTKNLNARLLIDSRLYKKYDFNNISLENWNVVKKLEWLDDGDCPLPEHETGYYYKVF